MHPIKFPYFDLILTEIDKGNIDVEKAFSRHVHWGYWKKPQSANGTIADFSNATEELCRMICEIAEVKKGMRVLDVGCGFGGTIDILNEKISPVNLVGINIDFRQLQKAKKIVNTFKGNNITFIHGNACNLPFKDNSFDVILALECIFHFSDRAIFLRDVNRVLRSKGRLVLSDFVISQKKQLFLDGFNRIMERFITIFYGNTNTKYTIENYQNIAKHLGFTPLLEQDITAEIMPTYRVLIHLLKQINPFSMIRIMATRLIELSQRSGRIRYKILAYEKN